MDVTLRNVEERAFRKFKAMCAEGGVTMGEAVSALMVSYSPPKKTGRMTANKAVHLHQIRDLGEHIRLLRSKDFARGGRKKLRVKR